MQGVGEVVGSKKAERKIEKKLKSLDSTFSYKLFEGQLISFLKMTLFSDDTSNFACFEGAHVPERYKDLIDMNYHGTVALKTIISPPLPKLDFPSDDPNARTVAAASMPPINEPALTVRLHMI